MPLDPFVETMLQRIATSDAPPMVDGTPEMARQMYRAMQSSIPAPHVMGIENAVADGTAVRIYRPGMARSPCVVYFHGGGWVIGDLETHDGVCRQLALASGMTVIAVDYRLAPEHPFPTPLQDCYQALHWIAENSARLDIDPTRIAVAGDSAGGNLAAAVCLKLRDEGRLKPAFQLLIYPVTNADLDTGSYRANGVGKVLTRDGMAWFWHHYTGGDPAHRLDPLAAPLIAEDLAGLPPACVITAEYDPLRDEGRDYADRLAAAGVATHYQDFSGMVHGFFGMTDHLAGARDAMALASAQLQAALAED